MLLALAGMGCDYGPPASARTDRAQQGAYVSPPEQLSDVPQRAPLNVILISLDTLRADRLGAYGYERNTSPNIDVFAQKAVLFERTVAESCWTLPSHVTMFTGLYPATHNVILSKRAVGPDTKLVAELLHEAGYDTIGITAGGYLGPRQAIGRGFDFFNGSRKGFKHAIAMAQDQILALDGKSPFFLFLHTYDIHCPYYPGAGFTGTFESTGAEFIETKDRCGWATGFATAGISSAQASYLSDRYDDSILEADADLSTFLLFLRVNGFFDDTLIIITSDHGEEFLEHGKIGHVKSLHRELMLVPLIIHAPGLEPRRISEQAGLVNITPTILDFAGVATDTLFDGPSLRAMIAAPAEVDAEPIPRISQAGGETGRLYSAMTPAWHLIQDPVNDSVSLYDMASDILEKNNVAEANPEIEKRLMEAIEAYVAAHKPHPVTDRLDLQQEAEENEAQLRALGYVE